MQTLKKYEFELSSSGYVDVSFYKQIYMRNENHASMFLHILITKVQFLQIYIYHIPISI